MKKLSFWLFCLTIATFTMSCKDDLESISQGNEGSSSSIFRVAAVGDQHQLALDSAVRSLNLISQSNTFWGSKSLNNCTALATVALEATKSSPNATYVNIFVAKLKQILSPTDTTNQCPVTGNLQHREGSGVYFALALAWNNPNIKNNELNSDERLRLEYTMKAALVACAYVMANYKIPSSSANIRPNDRLDMVGKVLYNSPNYAEAYAGSFLAAMSVIGKNNVYNFLNNYNHAAFITELNTNKLYRIAERFKRQFSIIQAGITYDGSSPALKAKLIEDYVRNIDNNEDINHLFFKGTSFSNIITDPINLISVLNSECFDAIAKEGAFAGNLGMANEFEGSDSGGVRDDLYYAATGVFNDLYNRVLTDKVGFWSASGQSAVKNEIDRRLNVGFSDINPKAWNGYLSFRNGHKPPPDGGYANQRLVNYRTGVSWWQRVHDMATGMNLAKEYFLNDSFADGNYNQFPKWSAINGSWTNFPVVSSFTGYTSPTITRPVQDTIISSNASNATARLISEYSGSNYDITVQCKVETFGTDGQVGIIGRSNNVTGTSGNKNYYLVYYNKATTAWKIDKYTNGVVSNLMNFSVTSAPTKQIVAGTVYFIRASFNGSAIKIYLNNNFITSIQDNNGLITSGSIGLYTSSTKALFDDVYVNQPN